MKLCFSHGNMVHMFWTMVKSGVRIFSEHYVELKNADTCCVCRQKNDFDSAGNLPREAQGGETIETSLLAIWLFGAGFCRNSGGYNS